MKTLIYIFSSLAIVHWVYWGIIVPSIRSSLRHRFFALRDRLRRLKIERGDEVPDNVFQYVESAINASIAFLPFLDLRIFWIASKLEKDVSLKARAQKRIQIVMSCDIAEIKEIEAERSAIWRHAFWVNTLPFGLMVRATYFMAGILQKFFGKSSFEEASEVSFVPEQEISKIIPTCAPA